MLERTTLIPSKKSLLVAANSSLNFLISESISSMWRASLSEMALSCLIALCNSVGLAILLVYVPRLWVPLPALLGAGTSARSSKVIVTSTCSFGFFEFLSSCCFIITASGPTSSFMRWNASENEPALYFLIMSA